MAKVRPAATCITSYAWDSKPSRFGFRSIKFVSTQARTSFICDKLIVTVCCFVAASCILYYLYQCHVKMLNRCLICSYMYFSFLYCRHRMYIYIHTQPRCTHAVTSSHIKQWCIFAAALHMQTVWLGCSLHIQATSLYIDFTGISTIHNISVTI